MADPALVQRLIQLEARKRGVDPNLALALATQESSLSPEATGDGGASRGLFQLQAGAAIDAGIDPAVRHQIVPNIEGGIEYLRQQIERANGDIPLALNYYNKGPSLQGKGDPQYAQHVLRNYEGVAPQPTTTVAAASGPDRAAMEERLRQIQARRQAVPSTPAVPAPTAPLPAVEAPVAPAPGAIPGIEREGNLLSDVSAEATHTNPPGTPQIGKELLAMGTSGVGTSVGSALGGTLAGPPGAVMGGVMGSYGARRLNQALGLEAGDPTKILPQDLGDVLAIGAPLLPAALQGGKKLIGLTRAGRALSAAEQQTALEAEEYLAKQAAYQDAIDARPTPLTSTATEGTREAFQADHTRKLAAWEAKEARRRAAHAQRVVEAGQAAEQGTADTQTAYRQAVTDYEMARRDHAAAVERVQELPNKYLPSMPERTMTDVQRDIATLNQGGPAADALTKRLGAKDVGAAAMQLGEEGQRLMEAGQKLPAAAGDTIPASYQPKAAPVDRRPLYKRPPTQVELQDFVKQQGGVYWRGQDLEGDFGGVVSYKQTGKRGLENNSTGKTPSQMAQAAQEAEFLESADSRDLLDALRQSVNEGKPVYSRSWVPPEPTQTTGALPAASLPSRGTGQQPVSRILYQRLEDVAGSTRVDMGPAREVASILQDQLGQSIPTMQPSRLQNMLSDIANMGDTGSVAQVHAMLKDLGPYTRSSDGRMRGMAKQLVRGLHRSLEAMPETGPARQLLLQANAAYRKEQAVADLQQRLRAGGPVLKNNELNELTIRPKALFDSVQEFLNDPFTADSFTPTELASLRSDIKGFVGTPAMPTQRPMPPVSVEPQSIPPFQPSTPPALPRTAPRGMADLPEPLPDPPIPVEPTIQRPTMKRLYAEMGAGVPAIALSYLPYAPPAALAVPAVALGVPMADMAEYLISKALLTPQLRPLLLKAIQPNGTIDPKVFGALAAAPGLTKAREESQ